MSGTSPLTSDVVIVGAGPVGLVAACELARRGVPIRVFDKLIVPACESRAIALHARSMEMLDRMGVADELIATGVKSVGMQMFAGKRRLFSVPFGSVDSAFPFMLATAQTETERVLTERLRALGATIERGVELLALEQDSSAAHLTLRHTDGSEEVVDTPWVIGADGGHSMVRHLVGARLQGSFNGERFILGDVDCLHHLDTSSSYTYFSASGPVVALPMVNGRMRFLAQIDNTPGVPIDKQPTQDHLQHILDERIGGISITKSHWLTTFEIHHGQVPSYRYGRVFLAGDAAHIHSPAAGQGMNTGMQDAFNLAWKLALAINGKGGEQLLDSYQAERYPVANQVIEFTGRLTTVGTLRGGARIARNAVLRLADKVPAAGRALANTATEVNISYPGSPIILESTPRGATFVAGDHNPHISDPDIRKQLDAAYGSNPGHVILTLAPGGLAPVASDDTQVLVTRVDAPTAGYDAVITDPTGIVAARYGLPAGGRIVIRPDGYIGAICTLDDTTTVDNYFSTIGR